MFVLFIYSSWNSHIRTDYMAHSDRIQSFEQHYSRARCGNNNYFTSSSPQLSTSAQVEEHAFHSERLPLYDQSLSLHICYLMELTLHFYRAKKLLWPSIPNPENSNAVQKIEIAYELVSKRQYNDDTIHFIVNIQKILYKHYWDKTRSTVMTWDGNTMVYKVLHRISLSYHSACQKSILFSCIYLLLLLLLCVDWDVIQYSVCRWEQEGGISSL